MATHSKEGLRVGVDLLVAVGDEGSAGNQSDHTESGTSVVAAIVGGGLRLHIVTGEAEGDIRSLGNVLYFISDAIDEVSSVVGAFNFPVIIHITLELLKLVGPAFCPFLICLLEFHGFLLDLVNSSLDVLGNGERDFDVVGPVFTTITTTFTTLHFLEHPRNAVVGLLEHSDGGRVTPDISHGIAVERNAVSDDIHQFLKSFPVSFLRLSHVFFDDWLPRLCGFNHVSYDRSSYHLAHLFLILGLLIHFFQSIERQVDFDCGHDLLLLHENVVLDHGHSKAFIFPVAPLSIFNPCPAGVLAFLFLSVDPFVIRDAFLSVPVPFLALIPAVSHCIFSIAFWTTTIAAVAFSPPALNILKELPPFFIHFLLSFSYFFLNHASTLVFDKANGIAVGGAIAGAIGIGVDGDGIGGDGCILRKSRGCKKSNKCKGSHSEKDLNFIY